MDDRSGGRELGPDRGALVFGGVLVGLGILFLAGEALNIDIGRYGWPMFVIVPGVALLLLGFVIGGEGGLGAAIPGGIITAVGLLLAYQNATDTFESWAYAWALVAPGSVGATLFLYGLIHGRPDLIDGGLRTAAVGLALFVGFGLFFENVIGIGSAHGSHVMSNVLPILAVALGVIIVLDNLFRGGARGPRPPAPPPGTPAARP